MTKDKEAILLHYLKKHGISYRNTQDACVLYSINWADALRIISKWASMGLITYEDHVLLGHFTKKGMGYHVV